MFKDLVMKEDFLTIEDKDITISVSPVFEREEKSNSFGYRFCFENKSSKKISIIGKSWTITDEIGNSFHDVSEGFNGEIPDLEPGEYFEFADEVPMASDNAVFYGSCKVVLDDRMVEVKMPTFSLGDGNKKPRKMN